MPFYRVPGPYEFKEYGITLTNFVVTIEDGVRVFLSAKEEPSPTGSVMRRFYQGTATINIFASQEAYLSGKYPIMRSVDWPFETDPTANIFAAAYNAYLSDHGIKGAVLVNRTL